MVVRIVQSILPAGGLITALLLPLSASAGLSSGTITGFKLDHCRQQNCIRIDAAKVAEGFVPGAYATNRATFTIFDKKTGKKTQVVSKDFFYDSFTGHIYARDLQDSAHNEIVYDLATDSISYF
jgi:hypothetical protein